MKRENARITGYLTVLVDLLGMGTSFVISGIIRGGILLPGMVQGMYGNLIIVLVVSMILISYSSGSKGNLFKRGFYEEFVSIMKNQGMLALIVLGYMFAAQDSMYFSRIFLTLLFGFNILICYVLRNYFKLIMLLVYKKSSASNKVMLVTESKNAIEMIRKIRREYEWQIYVNTIALLDKDLIGEKIEGSEVIANGDNLLEMAKLNVVDEVFINIMHTTKIDLEKLIVGFEEMGIVVHVNLDIFSNMNLKKKTINNFAGHQVITFSSAVYDTKHAILRRLVDIIGGAIGCIITLIITLFMAPVILMESKGPIFFTQVRIGKNGRKFKIYKFRSMYRDAEQRKKDLMELNEMKGLMFKMTDDPRITKVGKFIRKTSLDEFPQFFNVLMGNMSLVGTRPPTEDEFLQYEGRHKRRLSLKPGLTGLWQVSGRSNIDNFEDVVKLDLEYIEHCSLLLDMKLLLMTVVIVFTGRGSK